MTKDEEEWEIEALKEAIDVFCSIFHAEILAKDNRAFWRRMHRLFESRARTLLAEEPAND